MLLLVAGECPTTKILKEPIHRDGLFCFWLWLSWIETHTNRHRVLFSDNDSRSLMRQRSLSLCSQIVSCNAFS